MRFRVSTCCAVNVRLALLSLVLVGVSFVSAIAQSDTDLTLGLAQNSSYHGGDVDLVNLGTGNLMVKIPLVSYPQRGSSLKLEYDLVYNGGTVADIKWCPSNPSSSGSGAPPPPLDTCVLSWNPPNRRIRPAWALSDMQDVRTGAVTRTVTPTQGVYGSQSYIYAYASFSTGDGGNHVGEPVGTGIVQRAVDGSGFITNLDPNYLMNGTSPCSSNCFTRDYQGISYYPNGIPGDLINPSSAPSGQDYVFREDSSGNQIKGHSTTPTGYLSGFSLTDSVGRQINSPVTLSDPSVCGTGLPLAVTQAVEWDVPGPAAVGSGTATGVLKYVFCYANAEVFIPGGFNELDNSSADLRMFLPEIERIILPNLQSWTFQYDSSDGPNPSYGDLTKITLPTGGTITYTYQFAPKSGGTGRGVQTRTVDALDGTGPRTWTYSYPDIFNAGYTSFTTTVIGPPAMPGQSGDDTVHTFMSPGAPVEIGVTHYQGPAADGHVLQSTSTIYDPVYASSYGGSVFTQGFFPQTVTITTDGVLTSQKVYQYCCNFSTLAEGTETYGLVSDVKTYDYGSGTPGGLLKDESTSYVFQANSQYANDNMLSYVASKTVIGGGITAQTNYTYDEAAYITSVSGAIPNFGTPTTANPGYQTTVTSTVNGTSSISSHANFYNTGELYQQIDPRNVTTATYTYSSTYGYALPTQIMNAFGQFSTLVYDPHTGQKTSSTDTNSKTTTWSYDSTGRPYSIGYPDGGWVSYCYNDVANTCAGSTGIVNSVLVTKAENSSQNLQAEVQVDGLGRKTRSMVSEGNGSFLYTDTAYDGLGRVQSVSNPYRSTGDSTYGITQYLYDALSRKVQQTDPDSLSSWWCYDGVQTLGQPNCVPNAIAGSAATWVDMTDKESKHWQHQSDVLGRLAAVVEPDPISGALALKTQYGYNGLGDLVSVNQTGSGNEVARTRSFIYDSLGRLTNSSNPETGAITYSYLTGTSFCAGDVSLPCSKTDARGVITNFTYDNLNRLTLKSYVNSNTPSVAYGYDTSSVSGAVNTVGRLTSETVSNGQVLSQRQPYAYDEMGRVKELLECTAANCSGDSYHLAYKYDLDGNVVSSTNGIPNSAYTGDPSDLSSQFGNTATTFNGSSVPSILLTTGYDNVGRPNALSSSWSDSVNHPATLFQATSTGAYSPAGLANAVLGYNPSTSQTTVNLARTYDNDLRVLSETDASPAFSSLATPSSGAITITGTEGTQTIPATKGTGSIAISGVEGSNVVCTNRCTTMYDTGSLAVTVGSYTVSASYGRGSTSSTIAAALAAALNQSGSPVSATSAAGHVTITSVTAGAAGNYPYSVTNGDDFTGTDSGATLTGGADSSVTADTGQVSVILNGTTFSVPWGSGDTLQTVTSALASSIQSAENGSMSVSSSPGTINVTTLSTGSSTNGSLTCSATDTASQSGSASFSVACNGMSGGSSAYAGPRQLYSYTIPLNGGFTPAGNIANVNDSVTGNWTYTYDHLNRLSGATASSGTYLGTSIAGASLDWTYDSFGNRTTQSSNFGLFPTGSTQYAGSDNRSSGLGLASAPTVSLNTLQYDLSGNRVGKDGNTTTAYDAEGRICAVANASGGYLGYVYDAEGHRVAKGTLNGLNCDFSSNGFTPITSYVIGIGGEDLTEFNLQNGQWGWSHSDVYEGGKLLATYSGSNTYFSLNDWLGTKRAEVTPDSLLSTFSSLPFGDGLASSGNAPDVSEKHFTGKERDVESGLDYFGARYYASSIGHWMSPDWSAKAEPVPYAKLDSPQTLNLYSYVENNPITGVDPDGHFRAVWLRTGGTNVGASQAQGAINESIESSNQDFAAQSKNSSPQQTEELVQFRDPQNENWENYPPWSARGDVFDIVSESNTCSDWLNLGTGGSAAQIISTVPILNYSADPREGGKTLAGDPKSPISINSKGPFYASNRGAPPVGGYEAGTYGARMFIFIHELAHKVLAPGFDNTLFENESKNNNLVSRYCGAVIDSTHRKW